MRTLIGAACALTLAAATPAAAALLTFNTSDSEFTPGVFNQGWWSDGLNNVTSNDNYYVGTNGSVTRQLRDFFTFDLSSLNLTGQTVVSATLQATRFNVASDQNGETLGLFDVSTPAATLNANNGTSATIFNDLGTGAQYGSFFVSTTGNSNDVLNFTLNTAALVDITGAAGQFFSIGGALQSISGSVGDEAIFSGSGQGIERLVLDVEPTVAAAVPEPTSLMLLGSSLVGLAWVRRRRRTARL